MEFVYASERTPEQISELLAASFEGYAIHIQFSVSLLLSIMRTEGIDLTVSPIIRDNGEDLGISLVARRGSESRVSGFGIVATARGRGVGQALLDKAILDAKTRGESRIVLECNQDNLPAVSLYEGRGFVLRRRLLGFSAKKVTPIPHDDLTETSIYHASVAIARAEISDLPWQVSPASLLQVALPTIAYRLGPSYAILTPSQTGIQLRAIVTEPAAQRQGHGRRLIQAIVVRHPELPWNVSPLWPEENVSTFLTPLGFTQSSIIQCQMELKLAN